MNQYCKHLKTCDNYKNEFHFFTWSIPCVSAQKILDTNTEMFTLKNGYTFYGYCHFSEDKITFSIHSSTGYLSCFVSMLIGSKTLLSNCLNKSTTVSSYYNYNLISLSSNEENFQKLKQHPKNSLLFICKIMYEYNSFSTASMKKTDISPSSTDSLCYLKTLLADLKNSSEALSKEKVLLRVGEETESVSKAVLCVKSPVFNKMFKNEMREMNEKEVTITDIKMPVLKVILSFIYTGNLSGGESDSSSDYNLDFLCDLYYAADKYEIADLRQLCVDLMLPQISIENINQVMKLAIAHNNELLKSTVLGFISSNIETWFSTGNWKNLIDNEPDLATEVLDFLDF